MNNNTIDVALKSGIYYIKNKVNNKIYIGQSKNIEDRKKEHKRDLKAKRHVNWHLQKSFEKYGECNFEFGIIEHCGINELDSKEVYYIDKYETMDRYKGYNLKSGGDRIVFSQETLKKMSKSRKELCKDESFLIQMCWARSELSEEQVREIKTMLFNDVSVNEISDKLEVTRNQVSHIRDNNSFAFILPEYNYYIKNREEIYLKRNKRKVMRMYRDGHSIKDIARAIDRNQVTPYRIIKECGTIHDDRCRLKVIKNSYLRRKSLIMTLEKMGYNNKQKARMLNLTVRTISNSKSKDYNFKDVGTTAVRIDPFAFKKR